MLVKELGRELRLKGDARGNKCQTMPERVTTAQVFFDLRDKASPLFGVVTASADLSEEGDRLRSHCWDARLGCVHEHWDELFEQWADLCGGYEDVKALQIGVERSI
jgi:hypothetical protein